MSGERWDSRAGQAGFTLIEMLVSLMILVLILSFIPGTLRIGQRVWETDEAFEDRAALSSFRRYAEQRIAEAMPVHRRDRSGAVSIEFTGEPERMAFIAPAAAGPAGGGVYRFELRRDDGGAEGQPPLLLKQSLYRYQEPWQNAGPAPDAMEHRSHIGVTRLSLRYFGAAEPQAAPQWHSRWPRRDRLPDLVELSIISAGTLPKSERALVQLRLNDAP
jgi:general secretion pathway protein J